MSSISRDGPPEGPPESPAACPPGAGTTWLMRAGKALKRGWLAYLDWRLERLTMERLSWMSERHLQDLGLSWPDADRPKAEIDRQPVLNGRCW